MTKESCTGKMKVFTQTSDVCDSKLTVLRDEGLADCKRVDVEEDETAVQYHHVLWFLSKP